MFFLVLIFENQTFSIIIEQLKLIHYKIKITQNKYLKDEKKPQ